MREVARQSRDGGRERETTFSLPQSASLTAPSSEGALVGGHHRYIYVLVNDPTTGYGIFIENMLIIPSTKRTAEILLKNGSKMFIK